MKSRSTSALLAILFLVGSCQCAISWGSIVGLGGQQNETIENGTQPTPPPPATRMLLNQSPVLQHPVVPQANQRRQTVKVDLLPQPGAQPQTGDIQINPSQIQFSVPGASDAVSAQIISQIRGQLGNQPLKLSELNQKFVHFQATVPGVLINRTEITNVEEQVLDQTNKTTRTVVSRGGPSASSGSTYSSGRSALLKNQARGAMPDYSGTNYEYTVPQTSSYQQAEAKYTQNYQAQPQTYSQPQGYSQQKTETYTQQSSYQQQNYQKPQESNYQAPQPQAAPYAKPQEGYNQQQQQGYQKTESSSNYAQQQSYQQPQGYQKQESYQQQGYQKQPESYNQQPQQQGYQKQESYTQQASYSKQPSGSYQQQQSYQQPQQQVKIVYVEVCSNPTPVSYSQPKAQPSYQQAPASAQYQQPPQPQVYDQQPGQLYQQPAPAPQVYKEGSDNTGIYDVANSIGSVGSELRNSTLEAGKEAKDGLQATLEANEIVQQKLAEMYQLQQQLQSLQSQLSYGNYGIQLPSIQVQSYSPPPSYSSQSYSTPSYGSSSSSSYSAPKVQTYGKTIVTTGPGYSSQTLTNTEEYSTAKVDQAPAKGNYQQSYSQPKQTYTQPQQYKATPSNYQKAPAPAPTYSAPSYSQQQPQLKISSTITKEKVAINQPTKAEYGAAPAKYRK